MRIVFQTRVYLVALALGLIGERRVVQDDTKRAIGILLIAPAFVHFGNFSILISHDDPTHPHSGIAFHEYC